MSRFNFRFWVCFTAMFLFASTILAAHGGPEQSAGRGLTAADVKQLISGKNKPTILDVRSLKEYKYSHIPGAVNVPSPAVRMLKKRYPADRSALIILYAGSDYPPITRAFRTLFEMGYKNVQVFPGGIAEWIDNHYPVRKGTRP